MNNLKLDIAFWDYDRTRAVADGTVKIDGVELFKHHRLDCQAISFGVIGQIFLGRGARLDAHGLALELLGALDLALDRHHKALAVVVDHGGLAQADGGVTRQGEGGVAREHVHFARLHGRKARLGGQGHVFHFFGIAQGGRCHSAADIDVDTSPFAIGIGGAKAGQTGVHATDDLATGFDCVQGFASMGRCPGDAASDGQRRDER